MANWEERKAEVLKFMQEFGLKHRFPPTMRQIHKATGIPLGSFHRVMLKLATDGKIDKDDITARGSTLAHGTDDHGVHIPQGYTGYGWGYEKGWEQGCEDEKGKAAVLELELATHVEAVQNLTKNNDELGKLVDELVGEASDKDALLKGKDNHINGLIHEIEVLKKQNTQLADLVEKKLTTNEALAASKLEGYTQGYSDGVKSGGGTKVPPVIQAHPSKGHASGDDCQCWINGFNDGAESHQDGQGCSTADCPCWTNGYDHGVETGVGGPDHEKAYTHIPGDVEVCPCYQSGHDDGYQVKVEQGYAEGYYEGYKDGLGVNLQEALDMINALKLKGAGP